MVFFRHERVGMNEGRCAIKHCFVSGESRLQSKDPQYADRVVRTNQMKKKKKKKKKKKSRPTLLARKIQ